MPTTPSSESDRRRHAVGQLDACRRWLLERFDAALQRMLARADRTLYALSEQASDDPLRPAYFDLMRSLRLQHDRLHGSVHAELSVRLGALLTGRALLPSRHAGSDLLLEQTLATDAMATRVRIACDDAAALPGRRLANLIAATHAQVESPTPAEELLEPGLFCAVMHGAVQALPIDVTAKVVLLKLLERHMAPELLALYADLHAALDEILGTSDPGVASEAASAANGPAGASFEGVLQRLLRHSPADGQVRAAGWQLRDTLVARRAALRAQLQAARPWRAQTLHRLDLSAMGNLPTHVLAANALAALACGRTAGVPGADGPSCEDHAMLAACVQVALPLLALEHASALLEPNHPVHEVLLLVKAVLARADGEVSATGIVIVCEDLLADEPSMTALRSHLQALLIPDTSAPVATSASLAMANEFAERELSLRLAAAPVLGIVKRFALDYWKGLIVTEYVQHGEHSPACRQSLETMDALLWSLTPKHETSEREQLISTLPQLLDALERGMQRIGMPEAAGSELIASLAACHADIIRGQTPAYTLVEPEPEPEPAPAAPETPPRMDSAPDGSARTPTGKRTGNAPELLARAMQRANLHIFKTARKQSTCRGIQSSFACVWFQAREVTVARAGTAELFRYRAGKFEALLATRAGDEPPALGQQVEFKPRVATSVAGDAETFVLCSDGLTAVLSPAQVGALCAKFTDSAEHTAQALMQSATGKGLNDNASVAIVRTHLDKGGQVVLECASASGSGAEHDYDQEATICDTSSRFALVCDGIGGTRSGHIASGMAACSVSEDLSKATRRFNLDGRTTESCAPAQELAPWDDVLGDEDARLFAVDTHAGAGATAAEQAALNLARALPGTSRPDTADTGTA